MTGSAGTAGALGTSELLEAVTEVARLTGTHAMRYFRQSVTVEDKLDGSPVTVADRESELAAREWISAHFPRDGVLGEEHGEDRPDAPCRWVLDPIDGTKSFVHGVPLWGTIVAVARGTEVLAGAVYCAALDEMVVAAPGAGCWWNGTRCRVSDMATLETATILTTDSRFPDHPQRGERWHDLESRVRIARTWGDCYGYLLVATGRAEVMADPVMSAWDSAALLPIISEAGGVFTDWDGNATGFGGSGIATNAALAAEVREALRCSI